MSAAAASGKAEASAKKEKDAKKGAKDQDKADKAKAKAEPEEEEEEEHEDADGEHGEGEDGEGGEEASSERDTKVDLTDANVVTKYRAAGDIVNAALAEVSKAAKAGAKVSELCAHGDKFIEEATGKIYKDKKIEKGIAFPTCVSVNHVVGHSSPLTHESAVLKPGDLLKVDLGVHIDGYVVVAANSLVVGEDGPSKTPITGRAADAIMAAATAAELSLRLLKPGNKNHSVTEMMQKVAEEYKVIPVAGVLSHAMARWLIDGEKVIISKVDLENKVEEYKFEAGEIWTIDMVMSTGEGKPRESSERSTIHKRQKGAIYQLKRQASRVLLSEIDKAHADFPFHVRHVSAPQGEPKTLFGLKELFEHQLVQAYPVLYEKEGEIVSHVKYTVMILPTGPVRIAGLPYDQITGHVQSEYKIKDGELIKLRNTSLKVTPAAAPAAAADSAAPAAGAVAAAAAAAAPASAAASAAAKKKANAKKKAAKAKKEAAKAATGSAAPAASDAAAAPATK